jgi:uncharacterized repeat protein (TIGR03803 family)
MKDIIRPYFALLLAIGLVIAGQASSQNFKPLHVFSPATSPDGFWWVNNGGANPTGLTLSERTLYGITENGGKCGRGTIFKMMSDGSEFLTLHDFGTNDGAFPSGALTSACPTVHGARGLEQVSGYLVVILNCTKLCFGDGDEALADGGVGKM